MTLGEALALHKGSVVCHRGELDTDVNGAPVMRALRVTGAWVNQRRTVVLIRVASIARMSWLNAQDFEMPPSGKRYHQFRRVWLTPQEIKGLPVGEVPPAIVEPDLFTSAAGAVHG